jgi:hypothetical protein
MAPSTSRVLVVRAWEELDRVLIRVIVADSDRSPVTHVFTTVDGACRCVHELLDELDPDPRRGVTDR